MSKGKLRTVEQPPEKEHWVSPSIGFACLVRAGGQSARGSLPRDMNQIKPDNIYEMNNLWCIT